MCIPDNVRIVVRDFPNCRQKSFVVHKLDDEGDFWTVVVNGCCSEKLIREAIQHELEHIRHDDIHSEMTVGEIENLRHK